MKSNPRCHLVSTKPRIAFTLAVTLAFTLLHSIASAADSSSIPTPHNLQPGPHKVLSLKTLTLTDTQRNKDLQLRISHPDAPGPFPIIIWSHGAYGSKDAYLPLTEFWASHGYVVIQPTHEDSIALGNKLGDQKVFQLWRTRPADISFIIDSLQEIESKDPALKNKLDSKRVGVGGHSFGANTAQLVGGAKTRELQKNYADHRPRAIMMLSGQGPGEMLTESSWKDFTRPFFVMTGSLDGPTRTGQPAAWRKKPYELSPPGDKYLVWVEGLDHSYGGATGVIFNPTHKRDDNQVQLTKSITLAFWDAYLKDDPDARAYLLTDQLPKFSKGILTIEHK